MPELMVSSKVEPTGSINLGTPPPGLLQKPPFRTILYYTLLLETLFVQLPSRLVVYAFVGSSSRPHPRWSVARSLLVMFIKRISFARQRLRIPSPNVVDKSTLPRPDARQATAVWIAPVHRQTGLTGEMKVMFDAGGCTTKRIPAYWYGANHAGKGGYEAKEDERVIFFFHGGGYRDHSALPASPPTNNLHITLRACQSAPKTANAPQRALGVEYRLTDETTFPGILADALASWTYLVRQLGFAPKNVVFLGDSAGANLALALLRYIRDERPHWGELGLDESSPIADGVILSSPWIDISASYANAGPSSSAVRFAHTDYLTTFALHRAKLHIVKGLPVDAVYSKFISSVTTGRDLEPDLFDGFPRALCFYGGLEIFVDEIRAFAEYYKAGKAGAIEVVEEPFAVHDYLAIPKTFDEEQESARKIIAKWI